MREFKFRAHHITSGMAYFTFEDIYRKEIGWNNNGSVWGPCVLFPDGDFERQRICHR